MKKLKRSISDKYIFGVCGGLGEYLNIDSTIIRILWFILTLISFGTFALAYVICGLIIPEDDGFIHVDEETENDKSENSRFVIGLGLILIGIALLANTIFPWFAYTIKELLKLWPALLIVLGVYVLFKKN